MWQNLQALGPRMALVSRIMVVVWALVMGTAHVCGASC